MLRNTTSPRSSYDTTYLWILVGLLCMYGIIMLYSANGGWTTQVSKQCIHILIFIPISILIAITPPYKIYKYAYTLYAFAIALLILVSLVGYSAMGAKRWIAAYGMRFQPSEIVKITTVLAIARCFYDNANRKNNFHSILMLGCVIISILLIAKQPDLGTAILLCIIVTIIYFAAGVAISKFIYIGSTAVLSLPIIWHFLHDYQKKRIMTFINPESDPLGAGYNIIQSKIAIGSGGLYGKGLMSGTQSNLRFLPEHHTDFIFACLSEELGFIGASILILLYILVIIISLNIASKTSNTFSKLTTIGAISIIFSHAFINIAMVAGLVPVVGVPLPFISYGGTIMCVTLISIGLITNASIYRYTKI